MKDLNILLLATKGAFGGNWVMIIAFIVLFGFMYFTMIRPQKKQNEAHMKMMSELKKGDRVLMIDGMYGKVDSVNTEDKTVVIDADGIYLTFSRSAVRQILPAQATTEQPKEEKVEKTTEKPASDEKPVDKEDNK